MDKNTAAECILHIGVQKTGSTILQSQLALNRLHLLSHNILYPISLGNNKHVNLHVCAQNYNRAGVRKAFGIDTYQELSEFRQRIMSDFQEELRLNTNPDTVVILSNERFGCGLPNKDEIKRLKSLLDPLFRRITIVLYLRRQDEKAVSTYATLLRQGLCPKNLLPECLDSKLDDTSIGGKMVASRRYIYSDNPEYDYSSLLSKWSDVFGNDKLVPRVYDRRVLMNANVWSDFCSIVGMQQRKRKTYLLSPNSSGSEKAQNVSVWLNSSFVQRNHLRKRLVASVLDHSKGEATLPNRQEAYDFFKNLKNLMITSGIYIFRPKNIYSVGISLDIQRKHLACR